MEFQQIILIILVRLITTMHEFKPASITFHVAGRVNLLDEGPPVRSTRSVVPLVLALQARGHRRGRDNRQVDVGQRGGSGGLESQTQVRLGRRGGCCIGQ
jgi:hypothetical protein